MYEILQSAVYSVVCLISQLARYKVDFNPPAIESRPWVLIIVVVVVVVLLSGVRRLAFNNQGKIFFRTSNPRYCDVLTTTDFSSSGYHENHCPAWSTLSPEGFVGRKGAVSDGTISTTASGSAGGAISKRYTTTISAQANIYTLLTTVQSMG